MGIPHYKISMLLSVFKSLNTALKTLQFYFRIVRYEDMTDQVVQTTKEIFNFLNLPIQPETYKFLKEHCDPSVWKKAHVVPQVNMFVFLFTRKLTAKV